MSEDKVVAFDSGCISAGNFAAASFVTKAKLPMFLCSILPRLPDEQKWAFSFLPPPKFEVDSRYEYLKNKTDIRKIGILGDPSPYGMLMRNIAVEDAKNYGIEVAANESYRTGRRRLQRPDRPHQRRRRRRDHHDRPGQRGDHRSQQHQASRPEQDAAARQHQ